MHVQSLLMLLIALGGLAGASACEELPEPNTAYTPPRTDVVPEKKPAPKPPPPPCASVGERCVAQTSTRLIVGTHFVSFQVPDGWTFARLDKFSIAVAPESEAVLAFGEAVSSQADDVIAVVAPLLEGFQIQEVKLTLLKPRLKKPQSNLTSEATSVGVWEIDKPNNGGAQPRMNETPGKVGVFLTSFGSSTIVGIAFMASSAAPKRGEETGQAVQTLRSEDEHSRTEKRTSVDR